MIHESHLVIKLYGNEIVKMSLAQQGCEDEMI